MHDEEMKKVAFVIPVDATRHMKYATNLSSLVSAFSDVFVILSRMSDLEFWKINPGKCEAIVLGQYMSNRNIMIAEENRSMPTFKKWMGLHILSKREGWLENYDYVIVCDCEVLGVREIDQEFISQLSTQFTFLGDHPYRSKWHEAFGNQILGETAKRCGEAHSECHNSLYTWWSGLPVYETLNLVDFLEEMRTDNPISLARSLRCSVFDHLVYQRWIVKHKIDAKYLCLTHDLDMTTGWSLEWGATPEVYEAAERSGLKTLWVSKITAQRYPEINRNVYIQYHQDRTPDAE